MKLGSVTKLVKKNKIPSKKFDDDVMSANYDVIFVFPIYGQFEVIRKSDSRCIVYKTFMLQLIVTLYIYRN